MYDLHVHTNLSIGEDPVQNVADMAKRLGIKGIGIARYYSGTAIGELPGVEGIDLINCVIIKPSNVNELAELSRKARNKAEILMVHGGNYEINRAACENSMIDVLCHPELGRRDSGLDHVCARAAADNEVALEINFREILESYRRHRTYVLSSMMKNIKLASKYGANIVTASGAVSRWGLRSGRELASITNLLGLNLGDAIATSSTIPEEMITKNRNKLANKEWLGVKIVDDRDDKA